MLIVYANSEDSGENGSEPAILQSHQDLQCLRTPSIRRVDAPDTELKILVQRFAECVYLSG